MKFHKPLIKSFNFKIELKTSFTDPDLNSNFFHYLFNYSQYYFYFLIYHFFYYLKS